jgi:2-methylcitrate synthase
MSEVVEYESSENKVNVKRGLEGVVCDVSTVSKVNPETNSLIYKGYPVQDLAENCTFEEVAYLLWHDDLPTAIQLKEFEKQERSLREISPALAQVIRSFPKGAHPMDAIRTGVSFVGMEDSDTLTRTPQKDYERAMILLAKIPTILAYDYRTRQMGKEPIAPRKDLRIAENFFHMVFGKVPDPRIVKAFEVSLVLYAEHGFNASTFASRVVTSTTSDLYSAVCGGIGSLKGPLHGGANEQVMHMMKEIGDPAKAREWMIQALADKRKVMGFGHRVYKKGDSRVPTMKKYMAVMSEVTGETKWLKMYEALEQVMIEKKNIHPNLDFPAGPAYHLMGIETEYFTPIFVMSRITGWCAHIFEQIKDNRLIRPLCQYTGSTQRSVKPIAQRT